MYPKRSTSVEYCTAMLRSVQHSVQHMQSAKENRKDRMLLIRVGAIVCLKTSRRGARQEVDVRIERTAVLTAAHSASWRSQGGYGGTVVAERDYCWKARSGFIYCKSLSSLAPAAPSGDDV